MLTLSLEKNELKQYVLRQLQVFFPDDIPFPANDMLDSAFDMALQRLEYCFLRINYPFYSENGVAMFNHLHSDQYCQFLWFLANTLWKDTNNRVLCDKLVCLNKALNSILITYKAGLPDIFLLAHPVGTVLGTAKYEDFLVVLQNVTVAQTEPLCHLGKGVFLGAGAKVLKSSNIGKCCSVGVNTVIRSQSLQPGEIAFTDATGLKIVHSNKVCAAQAYFNCKIE